MGFKKAGIFLVIVWLINTLVCFHDSDPFGKISRLPAQQITYRHAPKNLLTWILELRRHSGNENARQDCIKFKYRYLSTHIQSINFGTKAMDLMTDPHPVDLSRHVEQVYKQVHDPGNTARLLLFRLTPF